MKVKQLLSLFTLLALLTACHKVETTVEPEVKPYEKGVFIVNEGTFGGTGTITFHNPKTGETIQEIFEKANDGAVLGSIVQSLTFIGDRAYIVVNGAGKVIVVNANTFEYIGEIKGLEQPRYLIASTEANIAYVSQWGADGLTGSLAKINLATFQIVKTIPVGKGPEKMLKSGTDKLYVANSGGFGKDSTITQISLSTDQVQNTFPASGVNPSHLAIRNAEFWCLNNGYFLDSSPAGAGSLCNFAPNTQKIELPQYCSDLVGSSDAQRLYFSTGVAVMSLNSDNTLQKVFDQSCYGLNIQPTTGLLYCGDSRNFSGNGEVVIRKTDGTIINRFQAGVGPGEIVFRD